MEMPIRTRQPVSYIRATSENGERHIIIEFSGFIMDSPADETLAPVEGAVDFELDDGAPVQQRNDGLFVNILNDEIFTPDG